MLVAAVLCLISTTSIGLACDNPDGGSDDAHASSPQASPTSTATGTPTPSTSADGVVRPPSIKVPVNPSAPGTAHLTALDQVTDQAFGQDGQYVPNSWGNHKQRLIRTSDGSLFTVYISPGTAGGDHGGSHIYHIMRKRANDAAWQDVKSGDAGAE